MQAGKINSFEDLVVWQKAHQLMLDVYIFANLLPASEIYNRKSQIIRSASSVAANIAEGYGRYHYQENIQFCRQARGSLTETKNHIFAARDLGQISKEKCEKVLDSCEEVGRLLNAYIRSTQELQIKFGKHVKITR